MIKNSLEWNEVELTLMRQARGMANSADIFKMIKNINPDISKLSVAEVAARRGKKLQATELLAKINEDITMVEEYLLIAKILG